MLEIPITPLMRELESHGIIRIHNFNQREAEEAAEPLLGAIEELGSDLQHIYDFQGQPWPQSGSQAYTMHFPWYPESLARALSKYGLTFTKTNMYQEYTYVRTGSVIGRIYFSRLIETLAELTYSSPLDNEDYWMVGAKAWTAQDVMLTFESILANNQSPRTRLPDVQTNHLVATYGLLATQMAIPNRPETLSAKFIADFRTTHRAELTQLQDFLANSLLDQGSFNALDLSAKPEQMREALEVEYERVIFPLIQQLENAFRSARIDFTWNLISAKAVLPPGLAAVLSHTTSQGPLVTALGAGGGLALGAVETFREYAKNKRELEASSPVHYLMSLKRESVETHVLRYGKRYNAIGRWQL